MAKALLLEMERGKSYVIRFQDYAHEQAAQAGAIHDEYIPNEIFDLAAETYNWDE
jgi:hypothetical protein